MVFLTPCLWRTIRFVRALRRPDTYWKKRKILKMAAHYQGRIQNCYSLAVRSVHRALKYSTDSRDLRKKDFKELYETRLNAACEEHGFDGKLFKKSLKSSHILLSNKILTELAAWEPRTFKCITDFAWSKAKSDDLRGVNKLGDPPSGVILRPMIEKNE